MTERMKMMVNMMATIMTIREKNKKDDDDDDDDDDGEK